MSAARGNFLADIGGLGDAGNLEIVAAGALGTAIPPGVAVLRRGILIAALTALEAFVRDRTAELLTDLVRWPARFEDFPVRFREAAVLNALQPLQRYAAMLKRQQQDYEGELNIEVRKMANSSGPAFEFTKFIAGDFTGNLSDAGLKDLLATFQVSDCWNAFRQFSSEIGFGIPSVHELVKDLVSGRHKSAHVARYSPTAADIADLPANLFCIGICVDVAMTASVHLALYRWEPWSDGTLSWRDAVDLYFIEPIGTRMRVKKPGAARALRVAEANVITAHVPRPRVGRIAVAVWKSPAGLPTEWRIL